MPYPDRSSRELQYMYVTLKSMRDRVEFPWALEVLIEDHLLRMYEMGVRTPVVREHFGIDDRKPND